jgi:hypothetical protein
MKRPGAASAGAVVRRRPAASPITSDAGREIMHKDVVVKGEGYSTQLTRYVVCGRPLYIHSDVEAKCVDICGVFDVTVATKRCLNKYCRVMCRYNYHWQGEENINTHAHNDFD